MNYSRICATLLILILSLLPYFVNAQSRGEITSQPIGAIPVEKYEPCSTPDSPDDVFESRPWYGNNAILPQYTAMAKAFINSQLMGDSLTAITRDDLDECYTDVEAVISVPIQFWIYLEEDNPVFPTELDFRIAMDRLNDTYYGSGMDIRFYMQCPQYVFDDDALVQTDWNTFWNQFLWNNTAPSAINVHVIQNLEGSGGAYYMLGDYIVVERSIYDIENSTLGHEIGHYFGLDHTHQNFNKGKCRQEAVDRNRNYGAGCIFKYGKICEKSGDGFCDTPADPKLSSNVTNECNYTGSARDLWGDRYIAPDENNLMSYSRRKCRNALTEQQIAAMWSQVFDLNGRAWLQFLDNSQLDPDRYEPDNSGIPGVPSLIAIGEKQCHSFHAISDCQDEVDWLRIDNSGGFLGSLIIEVDQVTETGDDDYEYPVAGITIWNTDEEQNRTTIKPFNRTQVGTKDVYEINCTSNLNDFLIEVIRKDDVEEGIYTISLQNINEYEVLPELIADNQICIGGMLSLNNLPDGASVSWSSSPNLFLSTTNGMATSIIGAGELTEEEDKYLVYAEINIDGCLLRLEHRFLDELATNNFPPFLNISMEVEGAECEPVFTFSVPPILDATSYEWSCSSGNINFDGCYDSNANFAWGSAVLNENEQINISISLEVSNDCGTTVETSRTFIHRVGDNCDMRSPNFKVDITPNPVTFGETMNIIITDESGTPTMDYNVIISSLYNEIEYNNNVNQFENQININSLSTGIHYLHVISGEKMASKMFVIQN